jgi:hypothetical protein
VTLEPVEVQLAEDPDADPDRDGATNAQEWAAGTDPHDAGSVLRLTARRQPGGGVRLDWSTVADRRYQVERAAKAKGEFELLATRDIAQGAAAGIEVFDDPEDGAVEASARFYRVRVLPIP